MSTPVNRVRSCIRWWSNFRWSELRLSLSPPYQLNFRQSAGLRGHQNTPVFPFLSRRTWNRTVDPTLLCNAIEQWLVDESTTITQDCDRFCVDVGNGWPQAHNWKKPIHERRYSIGPWMLRELSFVQPNDLSSSHLSVDSTMTQR